jgi:hypothetical protein
MALRIDKSFFEISSSFEDAANRDREYWLSKSPIERLAACELVRQVTPWIRSRFCPTSKIF